VLFPNSVALGGSLGNINEPCYIRIPSWKIHIFGLERWCIYILLKWQWSPAKNHQGPEEGVIDIVDLSGYIYALVFNNQGVCFNFVFIEIREPPDTDRGIGWLVSSTNLFPLMFSSSFLYIYIVKCGLFQGLILSFLLFSPNKFSLVDLICCGFNY